MRDVTNIKMNIISNGNATIDPPPKVSLKPPLSPEIQTRVNRIVKSLIDRHVDETTTYYQFSTYTRGGRCMSPLKVHIKGGILSAIEPDDTVNPDSAREDIDWNAVMKGKLQSRPDARWAAYRKMIYDPRRLLHPMKRASPKGDAHGKYVRISWDEALDMMASKIKEVIAKYGPHTIYDTFAQFTLPSWLDAGVSGYSIFSFPGHQFAALHAFGDEDFGSPYQVTSMFDTKLIVGWGWTPSEGGDPIPRFYLTLAREKGIPIITIHPRYTMTDEVQSDQWIPIRPGTDAAMAIAVANVLIKEDLYDKEFVGKFVYGFDRWKDYILGETDRLEKTPEWAEPITGVPAETIREFARLYARSKPCMLITGQGAARSTLTENMAWAGIILQAITGNIGKPGTFVCTTTPGTGRGPIGFKTLPLPSLTAETGRKPAKYTPPELLAYMKWADAILLREKYDNKEITKEEYHQAIGAAADWPTPNIRIWFPTHYSMQALMDVKKQSEAIAKLDLAVAHRVMMNDSTMRVVDLILPLVEEMERDPSFQAFPNGFCYCAKLLEPPGECKSEEWVNVQLAKRLGVVKDYFPKYEEYGDEKWDQMWEDMAKDAYTKWASSVVIKPLNPPSWEEFKKKPVFRWEMEIKPYYAFDDEITKGRLFPTKSGKIEAYSDYLGQGEEFLKKTKYGGYIDPYPAYRPEKQFGGFHDPDAPDRPLICMTSQPRYRTHSWMSENPWLKNELYEHTVMMSVPDAKARGIKDGDLVRLHSDVGVTQLRASVTSRLVPGVVFLYKGGYWEPNPSTGIDEAGCVNAIMSDRTCPAKTYANINRVEVIKAQEVM